MPTSSTARIAIYFAPDPESALWQFGSSIIGYDARSGEDRAFPPAAGAAHGDWRALTSEPRRYGFHATLKAPFHLAAIASEAHIINAMRQVARRHEPINLGQLEVKLLLGSFAALSPVSTPQSLRELEADCVRGLDHLRAALSPEDKARRLTAALTPRQREYLDRWGYPYVREEFRFHMTLTGRMRPDEAPGIVDMLRRLYLTIATPLTVSSIALFRQDDRASRFRIAHRFSLGAVT